MGWTDLNICEYSVGFFLHYAIDLLLLIESALMKQALIVFSKSDMMRWAKNKRKKYFF